MLIEIKNLERDKNHSPALNISSFHLAEGQRFQVADPAGQLTTILKNGELFPRLAEDALWVSPEPNDYFNPTQSLGKQLSAAAGSTAEKIITLPPGFLQKKPAYFPSYILNIFRWLDIAFSAPPLVIARDALTDLGPFARQRTLEELFQLFSQKNTALLQLLDQNLPQNPLIQDYFQVSAGDIISIPPPEKNPSSELKPAPPDYKILSLHNFQVNTSEEWNIDVAQNQSWTFICDSKQTAESLGQILAGIKSPDRGTRVCILKPREMLYYQHPVFLPGKTIGKSILLFSRHLKAGKNLEQIFPELQEKITSCFPLQQDNILSAFPGEISPAQELSIFLLWASIIQPRLVIINNPGGLIPENLKLLHSIIKDQRTNVTITTTRTDLSLTHNLGIIFRGNLIEDGPQQSIREKPLHPYSRAILGSDMDLSVPLPVQDPINGCSFHSACRDALPYCGWEGADLENLIQKSDLSQSINSFGHKDGDLALELAHSAGISWQDLIEKVQALMASEHEVLAKACTEVEYENRRVWVRFSQKAPPVLKKVEPGRRVACHLFK